MASDILVMWMGTLFAIWFFIARKRGDDDENRDTGMEMLGWFLMFMASAIGVAIVGDGEEVGSFLLGGIMMIVSIIKMFRGWNDS